MRKHLGFLAVLLLAVSFLAQLPQIRAAVLRVPDDYPTIQAAVDAAAPGDTIEVSPGVYDGGVFVDRSLTIIGQDKSATVVDGSSGSGYAFWLNTDGVTIGGFTMRYCSDYGVMADYSGGHTIEDNIFLNNAYGVYLFSSPSASNVVGNTFINNDLRGIKVYFSNGNTISNNYISGSTYGIELTEGSQFNSMTNNVIRGTSHGIYIGYCPNNDVAQNNITSTITGIASLSSDYTNIQDNRVSECAYGIELFSSAYNTVFANTASGQNGYGLYLAYANDNTISGNLASNNDWGIRLYESDSSTIIENTFSFNGYGVELISTSTGNTIAWNDILNNTMQMHQDSTSGGNTWNKKTGGTTYGNFWSDYVGEDTDNPPDGVGDTRLPHTGVDYYPLINPWSTVHDVAVVSVATSDTEVSQGELVNITVVVRNEGTTTETFTVTAKYINRIIETKLITNLARLNTTAVVFNWDTQDVPTGFDYEISAEASPAAGETDEADNVFVDGTVSVEPILGDVNGDSVIDVNDLHRLGEAFGSTPSSPNWNRDADLNEDNIVDDLDLIILVENYGNHS